MPTPELQALYPGLAKQQYWADVISQPVVPGSDQERGATWEVRGHCMGHPGSKPSSATYRPL